MTNTLKAALLATAIVPAAAFAQLNVGDVLPTDEAALRGELEAQGYTVIEFEIEDGEIEVEVTRDGEEFEIELDPETGAVAEIEAEDDDEDDDDDDNG